MTTDAADPLDLQHPVSWHFPPRYPLRNGLLTNPQRLGNGRLATGLTKTGAKIFSVHGRYGYRNFLFSQQANLVGKATGSACSFTAMPKKAGKDPEKVRVGLAIARARIKHGFTQVTLAKALGVTQQSVGEWERGETLPRGNRLSKLLKILPSLRSIFHDVARVAHHFTLSVQDYAILSPEQQTQVDAQITIIDDMLKRAAAQGGFKAPTKS